MPPDVIDFPSFPVFLRLSLLSILSGGLYWLLAKRYEPAGSVELFLLWAALFLAYGLAIRETKARSGSFLSLFILAVSIAFHVGLLVALRNPSSESPDAFLHAASPIRELAALLDLSPHFRRMAAVVFDLAALAILPALIRSLSLPEGLALVYGFNPLLVTETAIRGRLETIPLFFLLFAFLVLRRELPSIAAILYGVSLAGPPLFWATIPVAAGALRVRLLLSLLTGAAAWAALAPRAPLAELLSWPPATAIGSSLMPAAAELARLFVTREPLAVYAVCAGVFLVVALSRMLAVGTKDGNPPREALVLLGLFLFLSPEVLPWAFLPVAGLAAFSANPGWIVATATAPVGYLALGGETWSFWLAFVQYFPVYASLGFVALGSKRRPGKAKQTRLPRLRRKP
jgi:hypothetical protein